MTLNVTFLTITQIADVDLVVYHTKFGKRWMKKQHCVRLRTCRPLTFSILIAKLYISSRPALGKTLRVRELLEINSTSAFYYIPIYACQSAATSEVVKRRCPGL